jgi:hypothetical protein
MFEALFGLPRRCIVRFFMLRADVKLINIDSGTGQMLMDSEEQPLYSWDAVNRAFHLTYDVLRRQLTKEVTPSGSATRQLEVIVYGEGMTVSDTANNLRGKLYQSFDGTGYKTIMNYDFKGNPLLINENLLQDNITPDINYTKSTL